jgi:hypothetical protein
MTNADVEHRTKAIEAIEAAGAADPAQFQAAQVHGLIAIAQALLASESVLVDIRNELQKMNQMGSQSRPV